MGKLFAILVILFITLQGVVGQVIPDIRRARGISSGIQQEHAPVSSGDTLLYYMATRSSNSMRKKHNQNVQEFFYLFRAERAEKGGRFGKERQIELQPRSTDGAGTPGFAKGGSLLVFSKFVDDKGNKDDTLRSGLFFADRAGDTWINVRPFEFNDPLHNLFSPFITESADTLFFSADFDDAIGGYDIYVSYRSNGNWTRPENLGRSVNSRFKEIYPFYHPSGRLFFSSDGFDNNRQGFDIFQSDFTQGAWQPAEKIPYQRINSASNEYAFSIADNFRSGFFVRRAGAGTYDIYEFDYNIPEFPDPPVSKSNYNRRFLLEDKRLINDTIDPELFEVAWVINDTLRIHAVETIYAFPGPGTYEVRFEVYDKLLDSIKIIVDRELVIPVRKQAAIICPDSVFANEEFKLDASETYLPELGIERKEDLRDFTVFWDFGGDFGSGITTRYSYKHPGIYNIILGIKQENSGRNEEPEIRYNSKTIVVMEPE